MNLIDYVTYISKFLTSDSFLSYGSHYAKKRHLKISLQIEISANLGDLRFCSCHSNATLGILEFNTLTLSSADFSITLQSSYTLVAKVLGPSSSTQNAITLHLLPI